MNKIVFVSIVGLLSLSCSSENPVAVVELFPGPLAINECMVQNSKASGIVDCEGASEDWVELFNNSADTINLKTYYLSDLDSVPLKKQLPDTVVPPGGFFVMWGGTTQCLHKNHLGFSFSTDPSKNERVILSKSDGTMADSLSYLYKKEAMSDIKSYGRIGDGRMPFGAQTVPTPGAANK